LHAGVDIAANQREQLERLCRYVSRPPVASERLALTASGQVRYRLKTRSRRWGFSFWVAWRAAAAKKKKNVQREKTKLAGRVGRGQAIEPPPLI